MKKYSLACDGTLYALWYWYVLTSVYRVFSKTLIFFFFFYRQCKLWISIQFCTLISVYEIYYSKPQSYNQAQLNQGWSHHRRMTFGPKTLRMSAYYRYLTKWSMVCGHKEWLLDKSSNFCNIIHIQLCLSIWVWFVFRQSNLYKVKISFRVIPSIYFQL